MTDLHKIEFIVPTIDAVGPMELVLEDLSVAVSSFEAGGEAWRIEAITAGSPDYDTVESAITSGAQIARIPKPDFVLGPLPAIDWVSENQKSFTPIVAGRFFVHPSHFEGTPPAGAVPIRMDAGMAFGTGEHGTTKGCLLLIDALLKRGSVRNVLDVGCGTGILAIGCALACKSAKVSASDIDPDAVTVTRLNSRMNGLPQRIRPVVSDGLSAKGLGRPRQYDLVIANILAKPLQALAPRIVRTAERGGWIVLSGLLVEQESMVLSAYRRHGAMVVQKRHLNGWSSLLLRRGRV